MKEKLINKIKNAIRENDPNAEAFLFGSRARRNNRKNSDWDILILVDDQKITNDLEDKFRDKLFDIEIESGQVISTFIFSKKYWQNNLKYSPFYENVSQEGIRL